MPEQATSYPDPGRTTMGPSSPPEGAVPPMPYPGTTTIQAPSYPDRAVPPMPSEVTSTAGRFRTAMMPLLKMIRRTP
jgi:hypothetical protein